MNTNKIDDFTLPATGEKLFTLSGLRTRYAVLYFYPKDNTPGCTSEGEQFRDLYTQFQKLHCEVLGVSRDSIKSHENFKTKMAFPFDLLSDAEELLCAMFAVIKMKNLYGKKVRGIERSTFIVDRHGVVIQAWRGVKVPGHAQTVLDFVKSL
ncbi:MAG: peroxiredoxin [Betaproteobacteria bacterium]|nr:peroxiredoxin [Betaproteobacteria bacterium]